MSLNIGAEEHCEVYVGEEQMCEMYIGTLQFFGCGEAPFVGNMLRGFNGGVYQFVVEDFTNDFTDPNGDSYLKTRIDVLPKIGIIKYNGAPITAGFEFNLADVGNLTFELPAGYTVSDGGYCIEGDQCYGLSSLKIMFSTSDDSSEELYSNQATFGFTFSTGNNPPEVSDNLGTLTDLEYVFSTDSFTKDFTDPDGDSYKNVRIKVLPLLGALSYLDVPVEIDQPFLATGSSNLKFVLTDNYAAYGGVLYDFEESLDAIITDQMEDGYYLTENEKGMLTFTNAEGTDNTITGKVVDLANLRFGFSTSDNNQNELESEMAVFTLIPQGDINVKELHSNEPPTVGDNEFSI